MLQGQHFVLGYDTFIRLMDVKYYEGSLDKMCEMLHILDGIKTRFMVGGRLNARTFQFDSLENGALDIVPTDYIHMFEAVKDFRVDISSTELRAKGIVV